jgi:biotin carboxyl carrier protein
MELIARQGEREVRIRVERSAEDPDLFDVLVGEQAHQVRWTHVSESLRSMILAGGQHEVAVTRGRDGRYAVSAHGEQVAVEVVDPLTALLEQGAAASGRRRTQQIRAYMPGRVVSVLVEEGATVEAGQSLAVLEAMKMQNEILAEHAGVVKKVLVAPGQSVDGGEPMFDME